MSRHHVSNKFFERPKMPAPQEFSSFSVLKESPGQQFVKNTVSMQIKTTMRQHLSGYLKSTTQGTTDVGKDVEKEEPYCTVGGNANWYSPSGKQYEVSSKN